MRRTSLRLLPMALFALTATTPGDAHAMHRIFAHRGSVVPVLAAEQSALLIYRPHVSLTPSCDAPSDGDGGSELPDGDVGDAGCRMRTADLVTLVLEPRFKIGPLGARFALLTATPARPLVSLAPASLFKQLETITAPQVVYEDHVIYDKSLGYQCGASSAHSSSTSNSSSGTSSSVPSSPPPSSSSSGCSSGPSKPPPAYTPPTPQALSPPPPAPENTPQDLALPPEPYTAAVLSVASIEDLQAWLDAQGYAYDVADLAALEPYVRLGWYVVAVELQADHDFSGSALDSIALTYEASSMRLPRAIGRQSLPGIENLTVLTRNEDQFALDAGPEDDPVATREARQSFVETVMVTRTFHEPAIRCDTGCSLTREGRPLSPPTWMLLAPVIALAARTKRRLRR